MILGMQNPAHAIGFSKVDKSDFFDFEYVKKTWMNADSILELWKEWEPYYHHYVNFFDGHPQRSKGSKDGSWNNPDGIALIEAEPNAREIKIGHDYNNLVRHWNRRYRYYVLDAVKEYGFEFNKITNQEICKELRDPLFDTGCNDFPDWRDETDMKLLEQAYETHEGRKESLKSMIEHLEGELEEMN